MALSRARERLLRYIRTRKGREKEGVVLLEGPRVVETALQAGADFRFVLVRGEVDAAGLLGQRLMEAGVEVTRVDEPAWTELAETETPQGILAIVAEPRHPLPAESGEPTARERVLILDRIQDPGNVGTLIRSAAALGATRAVALDGTADPWSAKAVRASAGAGFLLPVHAVPWTPLQGWLQRRGVSLLAAEAGGRDARSLTHRFPDGWALAIGNEGEGLRAELLAMTAHHVAIPMNPAVESLNAGVAGSLLLWALTDAPSPVPDSFEEPAP